MADAILLDGSNCSRWRWRWLALLLILGSAGFHVAYFAGNCPLDLAPDEAHYWDWSRHLDWSYYSKGPLVAYLIRGSCEIFGGWSQRLIGNEMLAVRLPAILCGCLLLASLYVLTSQVYGRERLALAVVALALTLPAIGAGSSLMTIDAPYICCWGWALVFGHHAICRRSLWAWTATGLIVGLGILAKYTMVLWLPSLALFLGSQPGQRRQLVQPGFWIMTALAAVCCAPVLIWNFHHDWVTFRHVSCQAGLHALSGLRWWGPLVYVAGQAGLLLGFWFVAWLAAMIAYRPWRAADHGVRYLWWMSGPMFTIFFIFSFKTAEEPNWPVAAYVSGLVLTVAWIARQLQTVPLWYRRLSGVCLACACVLGLTLTVFMHHSDWVQPVLAKLSGPPSPDRPLPLRRFDPTCRLRGWRLLAQGVDRVRSRLRSQGIDPILAGSGWTLPGELGFYCQGHPTVYSLGPVLGDRHSQYDLWRPNPVWDREQFEDKTIIFVGEVHPLLRQIFRRVDPSHTVTYAEHGQPLARWKITVCRGYRGVEVESASQQW